MRRNFSLVTMALILLVAVPFLLPTISAQGTNESAGGALRQWEYRVLRMSEVAGKGEEADQVAAIESKFNELGRDGWEFCQVHLAVAVFKRLKE